VANICVLHRFFMIRTQIYLTEEQARGIKIRAKHEKKREAEVIGELVKKSLDTSGYQPFSRYERKGSNQSANCPGQLTLESSAKTLPMMLISFVWNLNVAPHSTAPYLNITSDRVMLVSGCRRINVT
jgi:hypothetical protein